MWDVPAGYCSTGDALRSAWADGQMSMLAWPKETKHASAGCGGEQGRCGIWMVCACWGYTCMHVIHQSAVTWLVLSERCNIVVIKTHDTLSVLQQDKTHLYPFLNSMQTKDPLYACTQKAYPVACTSFPWSQSQWGLSPAGQPESGKTDSNAFTRHGSLQSIS